MLLCAVAENAEITLGVFGGEAVDEPRERWTISTSPTRTPDEISLVVYQLLRSAGLYDEDIDAVAIASAVPDVTAALRTASTDWLEIEPVVVGPGVKTGMPILYDNPKEAGADRIAAAVGGHDRCGGPVVVVGFGAATTFDCVDARGRYVGGVIAPGLNTSVDALTDRAAGLRRVDLVTPPSVIGRTTAEAIQSGAVFGWAELVDGICRRIHRELAPDADSPPPCVATGRHADLVAPQCTTIGQIDPWVALWGLRLIWKRNNDRYVDR